MKTLKSVAIFLGLFIGSLGFAFGATIILTNSSDTLNVFRTNVNTSLTNLNNGLGGSFAWPWTKVGTGEQGTTTTMGFFGGFLSNASSTLASTTVTSFLAVNGTSTNFYVGGESSTTNLKANIATLGNLTVTSCTGCSSGSSFAWPFTKQAGGEQATSTTITFLNGFLSSASSTLNSTLLVIGSTTLQSFTAFQERTTSATSTDFSTSNLSVYGSSTINKLTNTAATSSNLNITTTGISFGANRTNATSTVSLNIASSTLINGASPNRASTTLTFAPWSENRQITEISCVATSTGGFLVQVGGHNNWTTAFLCDNSPRFYNFTAIQIPAFSDSLNVTVAKSSTTPDRVSINVMTQKTSD